MGFGYLWVFELAGKPRRKQPFNTTRLDQLVHCSRETVAGQVTASPLTLSLISCPETSLLLRLPLVSRSSRDSLAASLAQRGFDQFSLPIVPGRVFIYDTNPSDQVSKT